MPRLRSASTSRMPGKTEVSLSFSTMVFKDEKTLKITGELHRDLKNLKWEFREETFDGVIKQLIQFYEKNKSKKGNSNY